MDTGGSVFRGHGSQLNNLRYSRLPTGATGLEQAALGMNAVMPATGVSGLFPRSLRDNRKAHGDILPRGGSRVILCMFTAQGWKSQSFSIFHQSQPKS